ncbi:MAG: succinyldiaminopimelate transaminase [Bifidobacteriaceae bacterium]|jgi:succinyldiaminopimelate transaminase|nr:succinyldiaminopimelate transaminase [Bifidobacteriaceae bacterium]MCI1914473.1 succinyldiaminopimelate transaminase [Bifidobacteriaceae bacterium]
MSFHSFATPYRWERLNGAKKVAAAAAGGMIDLSVGSPVDPVPTSVRSALAEAADDPNAFGYPTTVGTSQLQTAISHWFQRERGTDISALAASVLPSVGSKEAVALMASLLQLPAGSKVVQPKISYPTYEIGTQLAGCEVVKLDVADTSAWENLDNVGMVWVNSPSNPTGETLSAAQLSAIVAAARRIGAVVVSDECYALMTWVEGEGARSAAPGILDADVCGTNADGVLCLYSLSKQSNMAGYRTAFIAGDSEILARMQNFRKQIGLIIPGPVQAAMAAGLDDSNAVNVQHERYASRLARLVAGLRAGGYDASMPEGALYVWVRALSGDCWKDIDALARLGLIVSPGEFYGDSAYLRFSATASDADIDAAAARLATL